MVHVKKRNLNCLVASEKATTKQRTSLPVYQSRMPVEISLYDINYLNTMIKDNIDKL